MTDLTTLTEITSPISSDIAYTVNLPASTKNPRKVTWANISNLFRTITEILTGKTIVVEDNTIKQTTPSSGDYLKDNGTKFVAGVFATDVAANSDVTANTAKVTNATHTGDATGSTALTIAADAVTLSKMASGTDGAVITYDASGNPVLITGTVGQVVTSGGAGVVSSFADAAGGGVLTVIENYEATVVEKTKTFSFTANTFGDISEMIVMMDGDANGGILAFAINSIVSYASFGREISASGPTETLIGTTGISTAQMLKAAALGFSGELHIQFSDVSSKAMFYSTMIDEVNDTQRVVGHTTGSGISSISSITISSNVNWAIGTRFTLYSKSRS